ncbi:MAG: hypothetical protein KDD32_07510 [Bacteroidetes bacterium]|nr:hypothetical protein [Bacteroidota bacterium]
MRLVALVLLLLSTALNVLGQKEDHQPVNGWEWKEDIPDEDIKQSRKEMLRSLKEEQSKYFNIPQGKWYFGTQFGYGVPFLTVNRRNIEDYLGVSDYFESEAGEISNRTIVTNDAGGMKAAVYGGFRFNQFVSTEIDLSFNYYDKVLQGRIESPNYNSELFTRGKSISLNPQIVLYSPNMGNFTIFGKFGFYVPLYVEASGTARIDDRNGTFVKSLATGSEANLLEIVDAVAELLGENVDGLGFLEDGFFNAIGYRFQYEADVDVDFRIDQQAIGYSGSIGMIYQISPLVSLFAEVKNGGYNITTKGYHLKNVDGTLDVFGNRNYVVLTSEGAVVDGEQVISAEELNFLYNVNYEYSLDENSNNEVTNPNGVNPLKPTDRLALRRSSFDVSFNVSVQFNFKGKKNK